MLQSQNEIEKLIIKVRRATLQKELALLEQMESELSDETTDDDVAPPPKKTATKTTTKKNAASLDDDDDAESQLDLDLDDSDDDVAPPPKKSTTKKSATPKSELDDALDDDDTSEDDGSDEDAEPGEDDIRKLAVTISKNQGATGKKRVHAIMAKYTKKGSALIKDILPGKHATVFAALKKLG